MTDEAKVRLAKTAEEEGGWLALSCNGDDFLMVLLVDGVPSVDKMVNSGKSAAIKGRWRIDSDKPDGIPFWAPRDNIPALEPHSNWASDAKRFLKKLEGRSRVIFDVDGLTPLTFDLAGLDTSALDACYEP